MSFVDAATRSFSSARPDHIESRLATQEGFEFVGFAVSGFDKAHPLTLVSSGAKLLKATRAAKKLFKSKRPDAVVTFGAYVSIPVGRAAFEDGHSSHHPRAELGAWHG